MGWARTCVLFVLLLQKHRQRMQVGNSPWFSVCGFEATEFNSLTQKLLKRDAKEISHGNQSQLKRSNDQFMLRLSSCLGYSTLVFITSGVNRDCRQYRRYDLGAPLEYPYYTKRDPQKFRNCNKSKEIYQLEELTCYKGSICCIWRAILIDPISSLE